MSASRKRPRTRRSRRRVSPCGLEFTTVYSRPDFHWFAPNGDEIYNVAVAFVARNFVGEPLADGEEGTAVRFFDPEELPVDLGPLAGPVVEDLRRRGVVQ